MVLINVIFFNSSLHRFKNVLSVILSSFFNCNNAINKIRNKLAIHIISSIDISNCDAIIAITNKIRIETII